MPAIDRDRRTVTKYEAGDGEKHGITARSSGTPQAASRCPDQHPVVQFRYLAACRLRQFGVDPPREHWTRAVGMLTTRKESRRFRITDRVSDSDRVALMGEMLQRVYNWWL
jgi:hypothetical protein